MKRLLSLCAIAMLAADAGRAETPLVLDTIWTYETGTPVRGNLGLVGTPAGALVIAGTDAGDVIALDGRGQVRWRDRIPARAHGWPTTVDLPAGRTILIGDSEGTLHAYAPDGTARWRVSLGKLAKADWGHSGISPWSGPAPLRGGGSAVLVVTDRSGRLSALTADGKLVWQAHLTYRTHFNVIGPPAVADLDGDGADEIVVSAFDGRVHCYGADGSLRWTTETYYAEGGYHAPLIVDHGDGPRVLLLGQTDGLVRALDGAGREVWRYTTGGAIGLHMGITPFREGGQHRLFIANNKTRQNIIDSRGNELRRLAFGGGGGQVYGPTAADLDGDGRVELLMPRIRYPHIHVLDADGVERATIPTPGQTAGAPLVAHLDGDRVPEVVVLESTTGRITALRARNARPGGEIQWPTSRGAFDGRRSVLATPSAARTPARRPAGALEVERKTPPRFQTGKQMLRFAAPNAPADAWLWAAIAQPDGVRHIFVNRFDDPDHGWIDATEAGTFTIAATLHAPDGRVLGRTSESNDFTPFAAERETAVALVRDLAAITGPAALSADRLAATRSRQEFSDYRMDKAAARGSAEERRMLAVEVAREHAALGAEIARRRFAGATKSKSAEIAVWPTEHPWTPFDPPRDAPPADAAREIRVVTERRSHEAASVSVANLGSTTISVRIWLDLWTGAGVPPAPEAVVLRRRVFVATARGALTPDAIPALDPSGVVTIPAGEAVRIWLDWDAGETPPGSYASTLHVRALTAGGQVASLPLSWQVLPVTLPAESPLAFHVWAYERPAFFDRDAVWRDLIKHHVNVFDLPLARATYDSAGRIVAEDWAATDEVLQRTPAGSWFLWSGQHDIVRPAEGAPPIGSPEWKQAFRAHVPRWMDGLAARGVRLDRALNYILDEPGIDGGPSVDRFVQIAELYKGADPRVRVFANPAGGATVEQINRLAEVTDVFDPIWQWPKEFAHFSRILGFGKQTWTYECGDGAKDNVRMEYYWAPLWRGAEIGLTGFGIWSYAGRGLDFWQGPHDGCCDWELVYHGANGAVVPSHRWQGVRIGIEDYVRLWMVAQAARRASEQGNPSRAEFLRLRRAEIIRRVVASGFDEGVAAQSRTALRELLAEEWETGRNLGAAEN